MPAALPSKILFFRSGFRSTHCDFAARAVQNLYPHWPPPLPSPCRSQFILMGISSLSFWFGGTQIRAGRIDFKQARLCNAELHAQCNA